MATRLGAATVVMRTILDRDMLRERTESGRILDRQSEGLTAYDPHELRKIVCMKRSWG